VVREDVGGIIAGEEEDVAAEERRRGERWQTKTGPSPRQGESKVRGLIPGSRVREAQDGYVTSLRGRDSGDSEVVGGELLYATPAASQTGSQGGVGTRECGERTQNRSESCNKESLANTHFHSQTRPPPLAPRPDSSTPPVLGSSLAASLSLLLVLAPSLSLSLSLSLPPLPLLPDPDSPSSLQPVRIPSTRGASSLSPSPSPRLSRVPPIIPFPASPPLPLAVSGSWPSPTMTNRSSPRSRMTATKRYVPLPSPPSLDLHCFLALPSP
jgi:hypothetical protein